MKTKHTPTLLEIGVKSTEICEKGNPFFTIAYRVSGSTNEEASANSRRFVATWNACEGIADPSAVPEIIREAISLLNRLPAVHVDSATPLISALARAEGRDKK